MSLWIHILDLFSLENVDQSDRVFFLVQVIVADNFFTGSKDNLKKWIGHPRFELIRHGSNTIFTIQLITMLQHYLSMDIVS